MKKYSMSFAQAMEHNPEHPERTAKRSGTGMNFDITFQVWPNRISMAKSIRMQQRGENRPDHWRACVALTPGEGH